MSQNKHSIMKFLNVIALIVICCLNPLSAQDTIQMNKIYRTWVSLNSEPFEIEGVLFKIKDTSILVSNSVVIKDYSQNKFEVVNLFVTDIKTIKTRGKNNIRKGFLIGAISGFVMGGTLGLAQGDEPRGDTWFGISAEMRAISYGVTGALVGSLIGAYVGSAKVVIPINGNINNYNRNKDELREYSLKK